MSDTGRILAQRREALVLRAAGQRDRLAAQWRRSPSGGAGGLLWDALRRWWQPAVALAVPLLVVTVVRKPGSLIRGLRWVWPAWQAFRTARRFWQDRPGL